MAAVGFEAILAAASGQRSLSASNNAGASGEDTSTVLPLARACEDDKKKSGAKSLAPPTTPLSCARCGSEDTKFCYYNNYNIKQPRFYCKVRAMRRRVARRQRCGGVRREMNGAGCCARSRTERRKEWLLPLWFAAPRAACSGPRSGSACVRARLLACPSVAPSGGGWAFAPARKSRRILLAAGTAASHN